MRHTTSLLLTGSLALALALPIARALPLTLTGGHAADHFTDIGAAGVLPGSADEIVCSAHVAPLAETKACRLVGADVVK
ncbi:MAG: hypothetical protein WBG76_12050 [Ornithinimicrobium sp.]